MIDDFVMREEFTILENQIVDTNKNLGNCMPREEIITRLNLVNDSLSEQLFQRPTKVNLKKLLQETDEKIEKV